ncbi:MAG: GAF domain-containing protein [Planctomycetaceae bacterium]|nr:GAF domain-containing protein [Planctomycetaceae bacterium]
MAKSSAEFDAWVDEAKPLAFRPRLITIGARAPEPSPVASVGRLSGTDIEQSELAELLARRAPFAEVATRVLERLTAGTSRRAAVYIPRANQLRPVAAVGLSQQALLAIQGLPLERGYGSSAAAVRLRHPVFVADARCAPEWQQARPTVDATGIVGVWSAPVLDGTQCIATIAVYCDVPAVPNCSERAEIEVAVLILQLTAHLARGEGV